MNAGGIIVHGFFAFLTLKEFSITNFFYTKLKLKKLEKCYSAVKLIFNLRQSSNYTRDISSAV